jgi:hypothetical protein
MSDAADFTPPPHAGDIHCRHYSHAVPTPTDFGGPACAVGCDLSAPQAWRKCAAPLPGDGPVAVCPKRENYTTDEIKAWEDYCTASTARTLVIMTAIPRTGKGTSGEIDCPGCKAGKIRFVFASCNGHLHAACSTPGCFGVIQ